MHKNVELQQAVHQTNLDDNAPHIAFLQKKNQHLGFCLSSGCVLDSKRPKEIYLKKRKKGKKEKLPKNNSIEQIKTSPQTNRPPPLKS